MGKTESLLTTEEVSQFLGISGRTICYWAAAGRLPAVKIGRHWHFRRAAIEEWVRRREQVSGTGAQDLIKRP
jgi:excisionase family DNA binding protein